MTDRLTVVFLALIVVMLVVVTVSNQHRTAETRKLRHAVCNVAPEACRGDR